MEGDSPVHDTSFLDSGIPSRAGHEKSCLIRQDRLARLNTPERPIVNQYREGKVKSTPSRGVK